jgi:hypothetical protein
MAKISNEERHLYFKKTGYYRSTIEAILTKEQSSLLAIRKNPDAAAFERLTLVDEMLNLTSNYIILSSVSQSMLKVKNEDALNEGRNSIYKGVIYLEEIVSNLVDAPFSEYAEKLAAIEALDAERRYLLIRKMGLAIQLLKNAYGDNRKWKWSFVELEGRYATVAKNILDLKNAVTNMDPRSPSYEPTMYHLRLIRRLFMQAADRYREKYELSTKSIDDFKMGILFLSALKRILIILGDRNEVEAVRKKYDVWSAQADMAAKKESIIPSEGQDIITQGNNV